MSDHRDAARPLAVARSVALALPWVLVLLAAAMRPTRAPTLAVLVLGLVALRWSRDGGLRAAWAAPVPVAVGLTLALVPEPTVAAGTAGCADVFSPRALRRFGEAAAVLACAGIVAPLGGLPRSDLLICAPSRRVAVLSLVALLVATPLLVLIGPAVAEPFFGPVGFRISSALTLFPALLFALSNAIGEEVAYRGAFLGWGTRAWGPAAALAAQAATFGIAHGGSDYVGPQLPVVAAMIGTALIVGVIARTSRSLSLPIAFHAAADVPLFLHAACAVP